MNEKQKMLAGEWYHAGFEELRQDRNRCDRVEMNYNCIFLDVGKITIGNDVFIGPGVHIYTVNHPVDPELRRTGVEMGKDVVIGDDVWIGGASVILPGVTIGKGTTIGAGSVVTKSIPDFVLAVGNPCKPIKQLK